MIPLVTVYSLLAALVAASAIGVVATRWARDAAVRSNRLDHPDARKVHFAPTPRVGGVGIAVGIAAGVVGMIVLEVGFGLPLHVASLAPVALGALVVFALGLTDDLVGLGFKWRFVVQAGVAWAMTLAGWAVDLSNVPVLENLSVFQQAAISVPLTVMWTVGLINAMNLLDGLDTLAGGTAVIGFIFLALAFTPGGDVTLLAMCAVGAGATLGFLTLNRPPASVFMGDGGSTLLGFLLAMAGIRGVGSMTSGSLVLVPVIVLGLPILDTVTQMIRRIGEGNSPFLPDRDHLHHRAFDRSGDVRVAVRKLHLTAVGFGVLAVCLRVVVGMLWAQIGVLAATAVFAYYVVRRLGYIRTRVVVRNVVVRLRLRAARRRRLVRKLGLEADVELPGLEAGGDGARDLDGGAADAAPAVENG